MVTDPISDMLVQLKNAAMAGKTSVVVPASNLKMEIAKILLRQGFLSGVTKRGKKNRKFLACELTYHDGSAKINDVKRISKPSRRVYTGSQEIKAVRQGEGVMVLSTPKGLMTDTEAKAAKVGGEILFTLW